MFVDPVCGRVTCEVPAERLGCWVADAIGQLRQDAAEHGPDGVRDAARQCIEILTAIIMDPDQDEHRHVPMFAERFGAVGGAVQFLLAAGFQQVGSALEMIGDVGSDEVSCTHCLESMLVRAQNVTPLPVGLLGSNADTDTGH